MHNATTKQRLSALRRKLGLFTGAPRWVRERRARLARLENAAATLLGFGRAAEAVAEVTPVPAAAGGAPMLSQAQPGDDSTRWLTVSSTRAAAPAAPREREAEPEPEEAREGPSPDLVPGPDASSPRLVSTSMIEPAPPQVDPDRTELGVAPSDLAQHATSPGPRHLPATTIEPTALEPSQPWARETGRRTAADVAPEPELVTTSDIVRGTSTSAPRQVSTSMIEPATVEPPQRWTRTPPRAPDLDTTADLVRMGKAVNRSSIPAVAPATQAAEPTRSGFPRRAAALAAAAVAAAVGLFLALRPRAPAPERAPDVEASASPAPAPAAAAADRVTASSTPTAAPTSTASPGPAGLEAAPAAVVIRRGDTLWALAAAHLGDPMLWPRLHAANRERIHDPDLIYPGQQIELPER